MKFLILSLMLTQLCFAQGSEKGGREGGGGSIEAMRTAIGLSEQQIKDLVKDNGFLIKTEIMTQIPNYFDSNSFGESVEAKEIYGLMNSGKVSLVDDFTFSAYVMDCQCPQDKDMCTNNQPLSPVCIDIDNLMRRKVKLSEFVGLLVHEHSHHFAGESDHEKDYAIAKFFEKKMDRNEILGKVFTLEYGLTHLHPGKAAFKALALSKNENIINSEAAYELSKWSHIRYWESIADEFFFIAEPIENTTENTNRKQADAFCLGKKFQKALSWQIKDNKFMYANNSVFINDDGSYFYKLNTYLGQKKFGYFTKITCVK